ncbi:urease accessory protein UreF [Iodidimonas gelatinilytica]|uniref:Urease accessory protein UreF n=1 Tax=Iodidimonas gelatinilytica TaxID=1236966 RepID=A0A5A7MPH4_9PROT|nr:urease accessory protein UreF [Iodidimonas gelatinilytica]GEQ97851.1 urease accessory protein UreF [Iodidimonas gelatinilytica]
MDMAAPIPTAMGPPPMICDALTLAQWFSPSFPVGAFAYSHGLETAIQDKRIRTPKDLEDWLVDILLQGSGRNDCILLRMAYACDHPADLEHVDATARAFAPSAERLRETHLQGTAFSETVRAVWPGEQPDLCYPVAIGYAARRMGLDLSLTAALYLQAVIGNLVSAAIRLVPLGQTDGQAILAALTPLCRDIAAQTEGKTQDDMHSMAFLSDIAAMTHETLPHRIFRS